MYFCGRKKYIIMTLDEIRNQILSQMQNDLNCWSDVISNTTPGNYGVNTWDISISEKDFYVDIPKKTFSFKNMDFTAKFILGGSHSDDSITESFSTKVSGKGSFSFTSNKSVNIESITVSPDTDLSIY